MFDVNTTLTSSIKKKQVSFSLNNQICSSFLNLLHLTMLFKTYDTNRHKSQKFSHYQFLIKREEDKGRERKRAQEREREREKEIDR